MTSAAADTTFHKATRAVLLLSFLASVFLLATFNMYEPDSWWHLKTGELIIKSGAIPHADPFTYTVFGRPWTSHQWLSEVIFYLIFTISGPVSLIIFKAAIVMTTFWLLYNIFLLRQVNRVTAVFIILLGVYLVRPMFVERPYILSFLLLALTSFILEKYKNENSRLLHLLPAITCIWANLHAGFIYGLIIIGIYVFENISECFLHKTESPTAINKKLLSVFVLSLLFSLLNPHGYQAIIHPFLIVKLYSTGGLIGSGMLPPTLKEFPVFWLLLAALIVSVLLTFRKAKIADGAIILCFTYLAVSSRRSMEPFFIMTAPILGQHLQLLFTESAPGKTIAFLSRNTISGAFNILTSLLVVAATLLLLDSNRYLQFGVGINNNMYPVRAVDFIKKHNIDGNMYNEPDWGGYLIWRLYPDRKVFVDSRGDVCKDVMFELQPPDGKADWNGIVRKYGINYTIMGYTEMVYAEGLSGGRTLPPDNWALVYWDDTAMVYLKRVPVFKELINKLEYRYVKPDLDITYLDRLLRSGNVYPILTELERKLREDPDSYRAHFAYGYILSNLGMYQKAVEEFRKTLTINKRMKQAQEMLEILKDKNRLPAVH